MPKERILPIFLRYKEPKSPIINRTERRLVERQLLLTAKHEITKHLKEVGKTFGQETK